MTGALEAIDRILVRGGDADDVLREVVRTLHERGGAAWAGIAFLDEGRLVLGPTAGGEQPADVERRPIEFGGAPVAELRTAGGDPELLDRVALLVSPYCLVGWDTGGEAWAP